MKNWNVRSQSDPTVNYSVTCNEETGRWECDCPYIPRRGHPQHCKHILQCQAEMIAKGETNVQTVRGPAAPFGTEPEEEAVPADDVGSADIDAFWKQVEAVKKAQEEQEERVRQTVPPQHGPHVLPGDLKSDAVYPDLRLEDHVVKVNVLKLAVAPSEREFADAIADAPDSGIEVKDAETAILAVYNDVQYVQKQHAAQLGYSFAGEAAILAALRPSMVRHGLTGRVVKVRKVKTREYQTKSGTYMTNTSLELKVRFTHAPSGTFVTCVARGEGSDSGDKSTAKAMTGAFKYAYRETFSLETGDDPDQHSSRDMERGAPSASPNAQARRGALQRAGDTPPWWQWFITQRNDKGLTSADIAAALGMTCTPSNVRTHVDDELGRQELEISSENVMKILDVLMGKAADRKASKQ